MVGEAHAGGGGGGGGGDLGAMAGGEGARTVRTPLLRIERMMNSGLELTAPVGTVTFFRHEGGGGGRGLEAAVDELRRRLQEVVLANPWVLGRIEGPALVFEDPAPAGGDPGSWPVDLFRVYSPGELCVHRQMDLADLPNALSPTKCGGRAKDTFVRISVVPDAKDPANSFALVFSMSHVVGDGHTYYSLLAMLGGTAPCRALNPMRKPEVEKRIRELMGGRENSARGAGFNAAVLLGVAAAGFSRLRDAVLGPRGKHLRTRILKVDARRVEEEKRAVAQEGQGVDFVSTNDVLTSWWSRAPRRGGRKVLLAVMAVNLRGRVEGCDNLDAGNYEEILNYRPGDFETPQLIRKSLQGFCRAGDPRTRMPTTWEHLRSPGYSISTNWSTFDRGMALPGYTTEIHAPLFDVSAMPHNFRMCIIFRPRPGELAAYLTGYPHLLPPLDEGPFAGPEDILQSSSRRWF